MNETTKAKKTIDLGRTGRLLGVPILGQRDEKDETIQGLREQLLMLLKEHTAIKKDLMQRDMFLAIIIHLVEKAGGTIQVLQNDIRTANNKKLTHTLDKKTGIATLTVSIQEQ